MSSYPAVIIGAGPAGLTAAYQLAKVGHRPLVLEKAGQVGGIARTESYKGYRFDIGGHRFFTKVSEVEALWHEILGDDFITVPRLSRIYYRGKFYPYPLQIVPTLLNLGVAESTRIMLSYAGARLIPNGDAQNLEKWVINRFGRRLYETFFKTYTEKVWGRSCTEIRADWAAQRIKGLSLRGAVMQALTKRSSETSLIEQFQYPRLGPGMMWERCSEHVHALGGEVRLRAEVLALRHDGRRVRSVVIRDPRGVRTVGAKHVINSMPITHLVERLDPLPPDEVLRAARRLAYRDFLIVALVVDQEHLFPDNWIYVHSPEVQVGRIQNFKNWSPEMVPDPSKTCLGMEYFCSRGDAIWEMDDAGLISLAARELEQIGLAHRSLIRDGTVIREPMAYPIYDETYKDNLEVVRAYLCRFRNLQTTGRAGMHRYNNQDHSMLTAMLAVRNILGEQHDLWDVNVERSYHEELLVERKGRATPRCARPGPLRTALWPSCGDGASAELDARVTPPE